MIPQYLLCDICGKKIKLGTSLHIETNGYLDSDSDWRATSVSMDLCPKHVKELVETYLRDQDDKIRHKVGQGLYDTYNYMKDNK